MISKEYESSEQQPSVTGEEQEPSVADEEQQPQCPHSVTYNPIHKAPSGGDIRKVKIV